MAFFLCEDIGYTYYSSGVCPPYHNQEVCVFHDKYLKCDGKGWCMDNGYILSLCTSPKIVDTQCPNGLSLYKYCVCPSTYKYSCSGTGYSGGSGTACNSKYTSCSCASGYSWSGGTCKKQCTDTCAQWRNDSACQISNYGYGNCGGEGTGEPCVNMYCQDLYYCCSW